jgi:bifunctional ADP-heptose synthase (sugar kinase/adenylyltransferase)
MSFSALLDSFQGIPALVVGDLMLDEYHFGHATRISPEAPVMVIRHEKTVHLPGGAANVALNLKA